MVDDIKNKSEKCQGSIGANGSGPRVKITTQSLGESMRENRNKQEMQHDPRFNSHCESFWPDDDHESPC